ncbi:S-adenosyl-L-methionine-dependent methyltransferase [Sesbania bispinosa]|nr:S-adenosyl-L-methionine-dependent methyltransferase [Sesbania bispinosa]
MVFTSIMRYFLKVSMTMFCPLNLNGNAQFHQPEPVDDIVDDDNVDEKGQDQFEYGDYDKFHIEWAHQLYEEEIDLNVTRSLVINGVDYSTASEIQNLTERRPKTVLIMGGGSRSAAREVLKHKDITKVIICEIDRQVVNLSHEHMEANNEAFNDERFRIIYNDAKDELERSQEKYDVIIGDLCEPNATSINNNLYTRSFYGDVAKPRLKENGSFVTYMLLRTLLMSSYRDLCGWVMVSNKPINVDAEQLNNKIGERINGELSYLDGDVIAASTILNKTLKKSLMEETFILK